MTGEAHWIDPLLVIFGGLGVVFLVWLGAHTPAILSRRRRRLICPVTGERVQLTAIKDTLTRQWLDIEQCSRFGALETGVPCRKACLHAPTLAR